LAKELGYAHPDHLLDDLTSSQISEWIAYDRIDPVGKWRDDFRFAYLSSLITNLVIQINGKKGAKLTSTDDFMFIWDEVEREEKQGQSTDEMKQIFLSIAASKKRKKK